MIAHAIWYNASSLRPAQEQARATTWDDRLPQHRDFFMNGAPPTLIPSQHGGVKFDAPLQIRDPRQTSNDIHNYT